MILPPSLIGNVCVRESSTVKRSDTIGDMCEKRGKVHRRFSLTWLALHHHSWNSKTSSSFIQHVLRPSLPAVGRHRTSKSLNHVDRKVHMQFNRWVNCFHVESTRFEQLQWAIASITFMMPSRNSSYLCRCQGDWCVIRSRNSF